MAPSGIPTIGLSTRFRASTKWSGGKASETGYQLADMPHSLAM
jgi:hypothetical protein